VNSQTARGSFPAINLAISTARKIAFETLRRVEAEGAYASEVLHTVLGPGIKVEDAALATELTMGVLRWRGLLDFLLERQLKKPVARLDLAVALALRIGLYQLRFLERIPARAAVNESVDLVKHARKASAASLVNAVLRKLAAEVDAPAARFLPADLPAAERLGILHSHPRWMVERWLARFGEARTAALLEANNSPPRLSCALHDPSGRELVLAELKKAGMTTDEGRLLRSAFAVSGGSPARTAAFLAGQLSIQDEASQAVSLLLDVHGGDRVLDLCAAPGGKTATLARAAGVKGSVVAADLHPHRLRAMREQLKRINLAQVTLVNLDATKPLPFRIGFDRVLVDAPCSGTGTLSRHPEIRWRLRPGQLPELHQLQVAILCRALEGLAPGGRLVYSTCSLEPDENEEVVAEALRENESIKRVAGSTVSATLEKYLAPGVQPAELIDASGQFRTLPGEQATDGFFAALMERQRKR
jgi:16S rRNA (cytosine967-C5)-methyltransferase